MAKVSVIIAMYNEEEYIGRCIESFLDQTYTDFEVILIDDGSTDKTIQKAQTYLDKLPLKILQQQYDESGKKRNKGPASARNRGVKNAVGDIIMILDADMYFDKNYIKELVTPILSGEEMGTAHGIEKIGNPENIWAKARCIDRIPNPQPRGGVYRALVKAEFEKIGGFNTGKGYFDDDMKKLNDGKGSKTIMGAICYHNNPTTLSEAFDHSVWVGSSLLKQKETIIYIKKYSKRLLVLLLVGVLATGWLWKYVGWYMVAIYIAIIILGFEAIALKRFVKEKDYTYFYSIPVLTFIRMTGYAKGLIYSLIK